mmetsp:Transcript_34493/g.45372  ORF Transcript_34493/g.45372 Transcript_34493/m.45372 type:complete len:201 (-) Transcript_34493:1266-1868(-)|eukprot:CAMPEP_0185573252 /NCGR_PEP_ID=MMETSP0434-20130131/5025_1 /TAXON_ID=626734 ORGANISM="Favella taraikaensis, Strain Fe Narragansett Bay" /NCGR_SAMPLE_ID=MMETSP0434 /ASSEMBLY_ACC=CAM_ASM_000379 /LENGTH=200 /DNA_ID=CAMNT_0028189439 /DNA_START=64 /DNA_END=666 /DNA_ORIENTATION=-
MRGVGDMQATQSLSLCSKVSPLPLPLARSLASEVVIFQPQTCDLEEDAPVDRVAHGVAVARQPPQQLLRRESPPGLRSRFWLDGSVLALRASSLDGVAAEERHTGSLAPTQHDPLEHVDEADLAHQMQHVQLLVESLARALQSSQSLHVAPVPAALASTRVEAADKAAAETRQKLHGQLREVALTELGAFFEAAQKSLVH